MKKVLFATTALVATAGVAAADITFSGSARMGVIYSEGSAATADGATLSTLQDAAVLAQSVYNAATTQAAQDAAQTALDAANDAVAAATGSAAVDDALDIHNRFTLNIDGSASTDSGIDFFARVRVRGGNTGETGLGNSGVSAPRVGLAVNGFTFAVGNINGALESMPGLYSGAVGLTGLGWGNLVTNSSAGYWGWDSFSSAGAGSNGAELIYSNAGFGAHLSYSPATDRTAVNASYNFGDWTVAGAYQDSDAAGEEVGALSVGGSLGNFGVGASYANNDGTDKFQLNGSATFGAGTKVTAYIADDEGASDTLYGLGFTHSLGGAVLAGGIASDETGSMVGDFGVRFSF